MHVAFRQGDARHLPEAETPFDLVVTHFFFDLYEARSQAAVIAAVTRNAAKRAIWCDVDFVDASSRWRQRCVMWTQYRFFRAVTGLEAKRLHDPSRIFEQHGWQAIAEESRMKGLVRLRLRERCLDETRVRVHVW